MDVEDWIVLFVTSWILIGALTTDSTDVFLTLTLIGLLIALEVGGLFLNREKKENIKPIVEVLLFAFALIVLKKIYEVLSG